MPQEFDSRIDINENTGINQDPLAKTNLFSSYNVDNARKSQLFMNVNNQELNFACSRLSSQLSNQFNQKIVLEHGQDQNGKDCIFVKVGKQVVHSFDASKLDLDNLSEVKQNIATKLNSFSKEDYSCGEKEGETLDGYFKKWSIDTSKYDKFTESLKERYGEKFKELGITDVRIGEEDGQIVIGYTTKDGKFYRQRANLAQLTKDGTLKTLTGKEKAQRCCELVEDFIKEELPASQLKTDKEKIDYAVKRAERILSEIYGENVKIELDPSVSSGARSTPPCNFSLITEDGERLPYNFQVQVWEHLNSKKLLSPSDITSGIVREVSDHVRKTD